ncbi:unnamed protein product [Cyclocybe aegerita]|uniref:MYND-type domain-containing protein n=1 Tax=Cyclocybe aegerita TaxID=1973307 RepID=A0A8S0XRU5_CYCAE|nr:unnamed protein product [Cyclocybe aegerita]
MAGMSASGIPLEISCNYCQNYAKDKRTLQKCARCRTSLYCSRDCQKKDWPTHKPACSPPDEQREFVQKSILRLQKDDRQFLALQYALAHNLLEDHGAPPDHRKLWVLVALVILHPLHEPDFFSLFRLPNQPSSAKPFTEKSIASGVRITGFIDASDTKKHTLDTNMLAIWNKYRAFLDKHGREKALAVLVQFQWRGMCVFVSPIGIDPEEFEDAKKAAKETPPESWGIRSTNSFLL